MPITKLLREESNIILAILSKCEDVSLVDGIIKVIGDTTAAIHKPMYDEARRFYEDHHRFPEYPFFLKTFPDMGLSAGYSGPYSIDLITDFLLWLRQEVVNQKALEALNLNDYKEVITQCNTILSSQKELVQYGVEDAVREYDEMESRDVSGSYSGIDEIDSIVHGFTFGTTTVIAAPPSMFKTTLAQNIAYHAISKGKFKVAFISLELQKKNVYYNILSRHAFALGYLIPTERIHKALLSIEDKKAGIEPQYELFRDIAQDFKDRGFDDRLFIVSPDDVKSWEPPYITRMIEQIDEKMGGLDIIFLDYIQICRSFAPFPNQSTDFVNNLISHITLLSKTYKKRGLIVFILSQVNRESIKLMEKSEGDRGMSLASFAEFHALERDAHYGFLLYASAKEKTGNYFLLKLIKHRTGATHENPVPVKIELPFGAIGVYKPDEGINSETLAEVSAEAKEKNIPPKDLGLRYHDNGGNPGKYYESEEDLDGPQIT